MPGIGIGIGNRVGKSLIGDFIPEYQTVYDSWVGKPTNIVAAAQNGMVKGWVDSGVYITKDVIHVFAAHTNANGEAQTNWKTPGINDAVLVNDPTFTAFEGFNTDGLTQHIETYNPTTEGTMLLQDSVGMSLYVRDNIDEITGCDMGGFETTPDVALYLYTRNANKYLIRVNDFTSFAPANTDSRGMHIASRIISNERKIYKNKILIDTDATVSTGLVNFNIPVGARWQNTIIGSRASKQYAYAALGGGLTQTLIDNETDFFEAYMDSNGRGVIT